MIINGFDFEGPMFEALEELDQELEEKGIHNLSLKVVGGFALMVNGVRPADAITDIDYIGPELSREIYNISEEVGKNNGMPEKWINNDLLLTGTTLEDLEYSTGELHFDKVKTKLKNIKLEVLCPEDLLKMKIIAIDTNLSAIEFGGDFTRAKDYPDILKLMNITKKSISDIRNKYQDLLISAGTLQSITIFEKYGPEGIREFTKKLTKAKLEQSLAKNTNYERSSYIENVLNNALKRGGTEI